MKRTILSSVLILALVALFYGAFSFNAPDAASETGTNGTIAACWSLTCPSAPVTTNVKLIDAHGNVVSSCTIMPPNSCCKMYGDFPTGNYHFDYARPTGSKVCHTPDFRYVNGTDVEEHLICSCP
jgi:hypothetical protein